MSVGQQDWTLHRKGNIDQGRHIEKIKDAVKDNLADIISEESIITQSGDNVIKIPIKIMDDYHFRHGDPPGDQDRIGQGDGKGNGTQPGTIVGRRTKRGEKAAGNGAAGGEPGVDYYEAEVDLESLAALIFEDLGLPRLKPVANKLVVSEDAQFTDITRKGPMSNMDKRRSLKENIKRSAIQGKTAGSDWSDEDFRFRTWEPVTKEESNAVVFALMDVSGCHTAGHAIEMADGSYKDVSEILVGDKVVSVDISTHRKVTSDVTQIFRKGVSRTLLVDTEDASLRATGQHVYFVYDESTNLIVEKRADELMVGDALILVNKWGSTQQEVHGSLDNSRGVTLDDRQELSEVLDNGLVISRVQGIQEVLDDVEVYDFEVAKYHNYIIDGILSHNSMGPMEKYIARSFYFWMVNFLRTKYNKVVIRFIAHHSDAKEVTEEEFFHRGESGGTMASSAYKLAYELLSEQYPPSSWNSYVFHFSDGDNFSTDNEECLSWAKKLKAYCNQVGYGQIGGHDGFGGMIQTLHTVFKPLEGENFLSVLVNDKKDIWPALKKFFHKELE